MVRSDIYYRWEVIGQEYNTFCRAELSCGDNGGCTHTIFTKAKKLGKDQTYFFLPWKEVPNQPCTERSNRYRKSGDLADQHIMPTTPSPTFSASSTDSTRLNLVCRNLCRCSTGIGTSFRTAPTKDMEFPLRTS
jgi:hypothetical protein